MTTAIVLAGGASSRFGSDKLAADLDGAPVLHHALRAAAAVADEIVLVLAPGTPAPSLPAELGGRVAIARDAEAGAGPLAGLAAGLALVRDHPPRIALVVGGDMPAMLPSVLRLLVDRLAASDGVDAMSLAASPAAPLPLAVRTAGAADVILASLDRGRRSLRSLLEAVPSATVPEPDWRALDPAGATLRDIDTPQDLERR